MRALLLVAILFVLPSALAGILPPTDVPVLASAQGGARGWAAFHVAGHGKLVAEIELLGTQYPAFVAIDVLAPNGTSLGYGFTGLFYGGQGVQAHVDGGSGPRVDFARYDRFPGGATGIQATFPQLDGEYTLVLWAAGPKGSWDADVRGDAGVTLVGQSSGSAAHYATAETFGGAANAMAVELGLGAHAVVGGQVVVASQHHLVGFYQSIEPAPYVMTMDGAACACLFLDATRGPGTTTFGLDGADAGIEALDDVLLLAADVDLPA